MPPGYGWLEGWVLDDEHGPAGIVTLTIARVSPEAFLEGVGASTPYQTVVGVPALSAESPPGYGLVGVTRAFDNEGRVIPGLALGAECPGDASYQAAAVLSEPDGEVMSFHYDHGQDWFTWAKDGVPLAEFSLWTGLEEGAYGGSNLPDAAARVREAGFDPDHGTDDPCAAAATLMTMAFGAVITQTLLDDAQFTCGAVKLPR
jgi:hypothetical protein